MFSLSGSLGDDTHSVSVGELIYGHVEVVCAYTQEVLQPERIAALCVRKCMRIY